MKTPGQARHLQPTPVMTGEELRDLRRSWNLKQEELAHVLNISKSYVQKLESSVRHVPDLICELARALERALSVGSALKGNLSAIRNLPRRWHDWRRSKNFGQQPSFSTLPACGCGDINCNLTPVADGDWPNGIHFWKFQGIRCRKIRYANRYGKIVPAPPRYAGDRVPRRQCSACGRWQALGKKYSVRLGCDVWTRYCRRKKGDAANLKHDPPTHYAERNGRIVELSKEGLEKLRGRSRREFPVPKCESEGCPRFGKTMERSAVVHVKLADGTRWNIATYRCRAPRPHAAYRVLPRGEVAEQVGFGRYRWIDQAGESKETGVGKRPTRKDRIMPDAMCKEHNVKVERVAGPWRRSGKRRTWRARCPIGREFLYVSEDGSVRPLKHSRWEERRATRERRERAQSRYREVLPAFQAVHDLVRSLKPAKLKASEKLGLVEQKVRQDSCYESIRSLWPAVVEKLEPEGIVNCGAWTPSDLTEEILAPSFGWTQRTFHKNLRPLK